MSNAPVAFDLPELFRRNRSWADSKKEADPSFFHRLVAQQRPRYFWIGCSDSRVPATEIVNLDPGEMFVHRNVANLALASDPNFNAALQFAVEVLRVEHIMVVGHYGCGGIQSAMARVSDDSIGRWLAPVREVHRQIVACLGGRSIDADTLCDRNVAVQVERLASNPIVRARWAIGAPLTIHGWIYDIADGLLQAACRPLVGTLRAVRDSPRLPDFLPTGPSTHRKDPLCS